MNELQIAYIPVAYLLLVGVLIVYTDIKETRIPNKLVLPAIAMGLLTTFTIPFLSGDWWLALFTFLVALGVFVGLTALSVADRIGMGDVKLILAMGLSLSPFGLLNWLWLVLGTILIAVVEIGIRLWVKNLKARLALAPTTYLAYTALVVITYFIN